ncbi:MAG: ornithine cyclodeaminase family protein [Pseudomonadota bacterium]
MLQLVSDEQIAASLQFSAVSASIERAFAALAAGRAAIKPRLRIDCGPVKLSSMGAIWLDAGLALEKVYPTVNGQFGFVLNLFDTATGQPLAVMQGQALTRVRTPALTALAARHGSVNPRKLAVFGAGLQGRAHVEALVEALPLQQVDVVDLADVSTWCAEVSQQLGVPVRQCAAEAALDGADVVVTATRAKTPLFDGRRLKPGAFVAAVGISLPTGRELDDHTLARAARVVVEWKPQSLLEAGEVVLGRQAGVVHDDERLVDMREIAAGQAVWRQSPDEVVVFKSVGVGLTDLAAAALVWERLKAS